MNSHHSPIGHLSIQKVAATVLAMFLLATGLTPAATVFERPVPEGGGPTEVRCAMFIFDIDEISDADQNFTVNLYSKFQWNDPREAHGGVGNIVKSLDEVWHPGILFINMQRTWANIDDVVHIAPNGDVVQRKQFWGDFSQPLKLHDFPFDSQELQVRVVAGSGEDASEISFVDDPTTESMVTKNYSVPDWKVLDHEVSSDPLLLPSGVEVASYALHFSTKRLSTHYVVKTIGPLLMIVVLSMMVFWLDPKEAGQLGVAVTSFLTMIAYHVALSSKLPEIPYLTRLDVFIFGATFLVFTAMIEVVITTTLARSDRLKAARRMDRVCRVVYPGLLVLVALYGLEWH